MVERDERVPNSKGVVDCESSSLSTTGSSTWVEDICSDELKQ
jgi:hypothetical protein